MVKTEKQRKHLEKLNSNQKGKDNRAWKGGRIKHQGYIAIRIGSGYVYEHILIVEEFIKRRLRKDEVIHHIDGDRSNNDLKNLQLMTDIEHKRMHKLNFWRKIKSD